MEADDDDMRSAQSDVDSAAVRREWLAQQEERYQLGDESDGESDLHSDTPAPRRFGSVVVTIMEPAEQRGEHAADAGGAAPSPGELAKQLPPLKERAKRLRAERNRFMPARSSSPEASAKQDLLAALRATATSAAVRAGDDDRRASAEADLAAHARGGSPLWPIIEVLGAGDDATQRFVKVVAGMSNLPDSYFVAAGERLACVDASLAEAICACAAPLWLEGAGPGLAAGLAAVLKSARDQLLALSTPANRADLWPEAVPLPASAALDVGTLLRAGGFGTASVARVLGRAVARAATDATMEDLADAAGLCASDDAFWRGGVPQQVVAVRDAIVAGVAPDFVTAHTRAMASRCAPLRYWLFHAPQLESHLLSESWPAGRCADRALNSFVREEMALLVAACMRRAAAKYGELLRERIPESPPPLLDNPEACRMYANMVSLHMRMAALGTPRSGVETERTRRLDSLCSQRNQALVEWIRAYGSRQLVSDLS